MTMYVSELSVEGNITVDKQLIVTGMIYGDAKGLTISGAPLSGGALTDPITTTAPSLNGTSLISDDRYLVENSDSIFPSQLASKYYQGFVSRSKGFNGGGLNGPALNTIDNFQFTSSSNAVDHGDLAATKFRSAPSSSLTQGFQAGGYRTSGDAVTIDKFDFASNVTGTTHGDLQTNFSNQAGSNSTTQGFSFGGNSANVEKFDFSSNTTASSHGVLDATYVGSTGHYSATQAFRSGGQTINSISKFDFASNTTAVSHGTMGGFTPRYHTGVSSPTEGFIDTGSSTSTDIYKFNFSTWAGASSHGDLPTSKVYTAGHSSSDSGFISGGENNGGASFTNNIYSFPYSSNVTATDIGNLTVSRQYCRGHEV
jgi:hypothetical protein